jgi:hypothetical protein
MKRAIYSIPLVGMSLASCGSGERVEDPIVANFTATIYDGDPVPYTIQYTDPETNITCNYSYSAAMEVTDNLKALIKTNYVVECDDGASGSSYTEAYLGDVVIVTSGAQYTIVFGPIDLDSTLDCAMDAAQALQCTDEDGDQWAFQLAN